MQEILIANIRTDGGVQSRVAIDAKYVDELAEQIKAGIKLPPVDVYKDSTGTWMADGFHRLRAHEAAGRPNIRAEIHKGGKAEAAWHSCGANTAHGLRRTNADKQRSVEMALKLHPENSDRMIAEHVGITEPTVKAARIRCKIFTPERVGKDGKTYTVPTPRQKTTVPPPTQQADAPEVAPVPPPPAPKPEPPAAPVDAVGREIPDYLRDEWNANTATLKQCEQELQRIERLIENDVMAARAVFHEKSHQAATAALRTLLGEIRRCIPYAICPYCRAAEPMQAGCKACGSVGYVGKHRWDTAMPEAMKA